MDRFIVRILRIYYRKKGRFLKRLPWVLNRLRKIKKHFRPAVILLIIVVFAASIPFVMGASVCEGAKAGSSSPLPEMPEAIQLCDTMPKCENIEWSMSYAGSIYDVPLSVEQQHYVFDVGLEYDVDPVLILAIMYTESRYDPDAISKSGKDIGIMQINEGNFDWLSKTLGITDLGDFYQNVKSGAYMLSIYEEKYSDLSKVLMCYHYGEAGAKRVWAKGIGTDSYCRTVITEAARLNYR